jgi:hypothetical protein
LAFEDLVILASAIRTFAALDTGLTRLDVDADFFTGFFIDAIIAPNCIWEIIVVVASCPYSDVTSPPPPIKYYLR